MGTHLHPGVFKILRFNRDKKKKSARKELRKNAELFQSEQIQWNFFFLRRGPSGVSKGLRLQGDYTADGLDKGNRENTGAFLKRMRAKGPIDNNKRGDSLLWIRQATRTTRCVCSCDHDFGRTAAQ